MKMNLPNQLTLLRVVLVPFFVAFLLLEPDHAEFKFVAFGIFVVASLTDMLDGKIARKYNLVTNFGKFADPLADKMLVCSALVCLSVLGFVPTWMTLVIIIREFIISGFRLVAAERGKVIAASAWGKWKTAVTMVAIAAQLLLLNPIGFPGMGKGAPKMGVYEYLPYKYACIFVLILMGISTLLTVISLVDYIVKNKEVLKDN